MTKEAVEMSSCERAAAVRSLAWASVGRGQYHQDDSRRSKRSGHFVAANARAPSKEIEASTTLIGMSTSALSGPRQPLGGYRSSP